MEWNVFYHNINSQEILPLNIFRHSGFLQDVEKYLKKCSDKEAFSKELRTTLMYYFWCRSEYELIISPWCGDRDTKEIKVDIYSQVMLNWDKFLDYVWSFKKERRNVRKRKKEQMPVTQ